MRDGSLRALRPFRPLRPLHSLRSLRVSDLGEEALLARIERILGPAPAGVLGIGDDAALVPQGRGPCLLTTDVLVEGTHFRRAWSRPQDVGAKALAVNLSDAAAMGGRPLHALVSLVLPPETRVDSVLDLYRGLRRAARASEVAVLGGNLARGAPLSITVALTGDFPWGEPILRSGARVGDRLCVTGRPGLARAGLLLLELSMRSSRAKRGAPRAAVEPWSSRGLEALLARRRCMTEGTAGAAAALTRFLRPEARGAVAAALAPFRPTAMIDLSDGLARDLPRLAKASGVRLVVDAARLPLSPAMRRLCAHLGEDPIRAILEGGEDYELVFTLPASAAVPTGLGGVAVTEIGEVVEGRGVRVRDPRGRRQRLTEAGFDHFRR